MMAGHRSEGEESLFVRQAKDNANVSGVMCCILSKQWYSAALDGKIRAMSNSELFQDGRLRENLQEGKDFVRIDEDSW